MQTLESKTVSLKKEIDVLVKERDVLDDAPYKLPDGRLKLDVGGCKFSTTRETLLRFPDSLLGQMFSGRHKVKIHEGGRVLIDRDGTHFGTILNFLRDPEKYKIKIKDKVQLEEFKVELEYYGLLTAYFGNIDFSVPQNLDWIDNNKIKVHSFSSQYSGFPATNTLNPSMTYWLSEGGQITNQWIVYEFPSKVYLNKIMMKVDNFECTAKDWMVEVTEEDEPSGQWNTVKEFQSQCGNVCYNDQYFEGFEVRAKYVRLYFKNNWGPGGGSYILVTNVKFFGGYLEE
jgi:hypothetical protein